MKNYNNQITTAEYLALKSYKPPTHLDYETAIAKLASEKVALETKLQEIKNILSSYELTEVFKLALIKQVLK